MLTLREISALVRRARTAFGQPEISPEYRGWSFDTPPVKPSAYLGLSLSDFAYGYCPTGRNLYLKYVLKEQGHPGRPLAEGAALHSVLFRAVEDFKRFVYSGTPMDPGKALEGVAEEFRQKGEALYRHIAARLLGELHYVKSVGLSRGADSAAWHVVPIAVQIPIDGFALGLGKAVADGVALNAVVEFKFGPSQNVERALAGYALAIEAEYGVPVDFGIAVTISVNSHVEYRAQVYPLGDEARRAFLEARDDAVDIVQTGRDPGVAPNCPKFCPFYAICRS